MMYLTKRFGRVFRHFGDRDANKLLFTKSTRASAAITAPFQHSRLMSHVVPGPTHMAASSTVKYSGLIVAASGLMLAMSSNFCYENFSVGNFGNNKMTTKLDDSSMPVPSEEEEEEEGSKITNTTILNWSGTHAVVVENDHYWEPETIEDVENIVEKCHKSGQAVRPVGSALSPNGIAFQTDGMISMANLDKILRVDTENNTVTVQAGARVSQVVDELRKYNLTLPNLASIAEQQMGGFVQVGAHGTGCLIAPVDNYVTGLKLVTPGKGLIELTEDSGELFQLAKVGLGCLGIVVEVTMKCIPSHRLVEHTYVLTRDQIKEQKNDLLKNHKHIRFMWIPYEDAVVVVTNDPEDEVPADVPRDAKSITDEAERFRPLTDLLLELSKDSTVPVTKESLKGMGFGEIRDALMAFNPIDIDHVKRCNKAEAEFWRRSEGYQTKPSDQLLQFDCGGQQWVLEVCFPTGTQEKNDDSDMEFMESLLKGIEERGIPAHTPIEQRWTASSSSLMSPAHGPPNGLHSWVGIIMYLPSDEYSNQRQDITALFKTKYCELMGDVSQQFNATSHWAKIERPESVWKTIDLALFLENRFPLHKFNEARKLLDPKNILSNLLLDAIIGKPQK